MGCGCKKKNNQNLEQPTVVAINQTQSESVQEPEQKIVDLIMEKLQSLDEETPPQNQ